MKIINNNKNQNIKIEVKKIEIPKKIKIRVRKRRPKRTIPKLNQCCQIVHFGLQKKISSLFVNALAVLIFAQLAVRCLKNFSCSESGLCVR